MAEIDASWGLLTTKAADYEQELLACCLVDQEVAAEVAEKLKPRDFYRSAHAAIFAGLQTVIQRGGTWDLLSLRDQLSRAGTLEAAGGYGALVDLSSSIPTTAHARHYLARVHDASLRRQLRGLLPTIQGLLLDPDEQEFLAKAQGLLTELQIGTGEDRMRHIADVIRSKVGEIEAAAEAKARGEQPPVISSGWHDLDNMLVITPPKLIILAARPAMGKSAMAFNLALHVAKTRPVLKVTLEMSGEELASRLIAADLNLNPNAQAHGVVEDHRWGDLFNLADAYQDHQLWIDDSPAATMGHIGSAARRLMAKVGGPLGMIVIDYLGLIDGDGKDETAKIGAISRAAKQLAKALNVPILMLCQLNRGVEGRDDKRPQLSDLRQSGAIEQDADVVMFAYRDEYYNPTPENRGLAELLIRKNRGGSVGRVDLKFDAAKTRFESVLFTPPDEFGAGEYYQPIL